MSGESLIKKGSRPSGKRLHSGRFERLKSSSIEYKNFLVVSGELLPFSSSCSSSRVSVAESFVSSPFVLSALIMAKKKSKKGKEEGEEGKGKEKREKRKEKREKRKEKRKEKEKRKRKRKRKKRKE